MTNIFKTEYLESIILLNRRFVASEWPFGFGVAAVYLRFVVFDIEFGYEQ